MAGQSSSFALNGKREAIILDECESGTDDSWAWVATLTIAAHGRRRLCLEQVPGERTEDWIDSSYELEPVDDGQELFEFLQSSWAADHFEGLSEEQWLSIGSKIEAIDPALADEIRKAIQDQFDPDPQPADPDAEAFDAFIRGATFEKTPGGGGGAMWAGIADNLRARSAIRAYCQTYQREHGQLPKGTHRVVYRFGDAPDADLRNPRSGCMRISGSATFDKAVTFPDT